MVYFDWLISAYHELQQFSIYTTTTKLTWGGGGNPRPLVNVWKPLIYEVGIEVQTHFSGVQLEVRSH